MLQCILNMYNSEYTMCVAVVSCVVILSMVQINLTGLPMLARCSFIYFNKSIFLNTISFLLLIRYSKNIYLWSTRMYWSQPQQVGQMMLMNEKQQLTSSYGSKLISCLFVSCFLQARLQPLQVQTLLERQMFLLIIFLLNSS